MMHRPIRPLSVLFTMALLVSAVGWGAPALAQEQGQGAAAGRIECRVIDSQGHGIPSVTVTLEAGGESVRAEVTREGGRAQFRGVAPGTYSMTFSFNDQVETRSDVEVAPGATVQVTQEVAWDVSFAESLTVYSASRRAERIVEAPAAVTHVTEEEVEREASHGQVPKLLEFTPGAQVTQSGLYDFNFNTRGFNSSLNRRIVTLIDGRDPSVPFLGSQEWAAISFPLDDLSSVELVRGPSSALYGANAFNGVLNLVTKQPRYSEGGLARLTGGDLSTINGDLRQAGEIGGGWFYKLVGGWRSSDDFTVSRVDGGEYGGPGSDVGTLPRERIPLVRTDDDIRFGGARLERYFDNGHAATVEGGYAEIKGPTFQTGIGRVQLRKVERPWARVNYSAPHWNVLGYWNGRKGDQVSLLSGADLTLDSNNYQIEIQGNQDFADGRGRIVGGASYGEEEIKTDGTLTFTDHNEDFQALFAQAEYDLTNRLNLVLAGRWDDSSLHDSQVSPKGSLVFALTPKQSLRLTYNEAFQVANYSEFFLQAQTAVQTPGGPISSISLAPVQQAFGVDLGFANIPILALGNADLDVETIKTWELGYTGVLGNKVLLTAEYYDSTSKNFISDLLPNLGAAGRLNPNFQFYTPPADLPEPARVALLQTLQGLAAGNPLLAFLSNNFDGAPILALATYTNFGEVDTRGVDLGLQWHVSRPWTAQLNYSWFDFDIVDSGGLPEDQLQPNAPENTVSLGLSYVVDRWDASLNYRWVDEFRWVVGVFDGVVESYNLVDLVANYRVTDSIKLGVNVSNLLDEEHWEAFGGDLLSRRALASIEYSW